MHVVARIRLESARRPWIRWTLVAALGGLAALGVHRELARVDAARAAWGTTREVIVASAPIEPGAPVAERIATRSLPAAVVPAQALDAVPPGAVARQHVVAGEVLTEADVAAVGGPAALTPPGWVALVVTASADGLLRAGDRVVVTSAGVEVSDQAVVVGVGDVDVVLAVPRDRGATVAAAASSPDGVALLLIG